MSCIYAELNISFGTTEERTGNQNSESTSGPFFLKGERLLISSAGERSGPPGGASCPDLASKPRRMLQLIHFNAAFEDPKRLDSRPQCDIKAMSARELHMQKLISERNGVIGSSASLGAGF